MKLLNPESLLGSLRKDVLTACTGKSESDLPSDDEDVRKINGSE
jgi:hypothetical protein